VDDCPFYIFLKDNRHFCLQSKIPKKKNTGALGNLGNKKTNELYYGYYVPDELGTEVKKRRNGG
jgi:hypothetical protein